MKKNLRIAVAVLVALGVIAYSRFRDRPDPDAAPPSSSGRFLVPAGTADFRLGTLDFTACELPQKRTAATTAAFCAPFDVPENWDAPDGRKIRLNLALLKSAQAADDDFIVFLAGGPGQAAIETWPQIAAAFEPARKRRHVLLLDQRGTGGSNALACPNIDEADVAEFDLERVEQATRRCLDAVSEHADPRFYTTTVAARDLEALRQALGGPQFNLVGVSYGTRMAQQYLKRYPEGVRSLVLDSPVPNELALGAEFARNLEDSLQAQLGRCSADPACTKAYGDPYASLLRLRDALRAEPREVRYPDPVSFDTVERRLDAITLAGLVRMFAYSPETASLIPLSVSQALEGHYTPLMGQIKIMTDALSELAGSGMQLSVVCAEDADRIVPDPADAGRLLGTMMTDVIRTQCAIWPHGERPADFNEPASGDTPVLILAGEFDPVTPPRYGEQIAAHLDRARLIVAKGQGHSIMGRSCLPKLVGQFMDRLDPAGLDIACVDAIGPTPLFIDFNGAAP
jgi:pimeloyl-ACP methyl ester carboxylesterase